MAEASRQDDQSADFTDMPVGEILRRTRLHYQQSIQDVEYNLRIRAEQIEAIENGDLEKLPARVYAIGFVRSYAEYLGLDGDKMVHVFKAQAGEKAAEPELHISVAASDSKLPPTWLVIASALFILVMTAIWAVSWDGNREEIETIPPVAETIQEAPALESASEQIEQAAQAVEEEPPPAEVKEGIILNIRANSWVEIRDSKGKKILSRVLKAGDQYFVPNRPDLTMSLGNAGGVEIEVDGVPLKPLGKDAQVKRRISLDAEYLKSTYAKDE